MSNMRYRPEIDGLRALSVIGVILFHFGTVVTGGYIGVDVFFVISGYLITQIIARETLENNFSLKKFWMRRIRRIIPVAGFLVISCLIGGYLLLDPMALIALAKSGVAYSVMLSNVYFFRAGDYFSESIELSPLLHTWSLSVEEQFYILYPIITFLLLRRGRKLAFFSISLIALFSLLLSIVGIYLYPKGTFYLLPTRAWELFAGGLLLLSEEHMKLKKWHKEVLSFFGIAGIVCAMLFYTNTTPFPGLAALIPVVGAVFFIRANSGKLTLTGRIFALPPVVFIGLISYSLYLWHWPVLAFSKHLLIETSVFVTTIQFTLIFLLSYLSWRFIETPFRRSRRLTKPVVTFSFGIVSTLCVAIISFVFIVQKGFPARFTPEMAEIIQDIYWTGEKYESQSPNGVAIGLNKETEHKPDFVLWGDSHGLALTDIIDDLSKTYSLSGVALLSSGISPVTGLWKPSKGLQQRDDALKINQDRLSWIINSGAKNVILVARWNAMTEGLLETEYVENHGDPSNSSMVADSTEMTLSPENCRNALRRQLSSMLHVLSEKKIKVWLLLQVPTSSYPLVARDFYMKNRFQRFNPIIFNLDTPRLKYEQMRQGTNSVFTTLNAPNLTLLDPISNFYADNEYLKLYTNRAFFRDEDHLTRAGAQFYLKPLFSSIFKKISIQLKDDIQRKEPK